MKIAFVVCGNGYGHLKRVCEVVSELFHLDKTVSVLVLGATHHQAILNVWGIYQRFSGFRFTFTNAELENNLKVTIPPFYSIEEYAASFDIVKSEVTSFHPDRIVSDNLVGLLNYYPDSMLMGSFLWPDILLNTSPPHETANRICELENDLLRKINPVLLGVEDMVMPEARQKTRFIGLPWFCLRENQKSGFFQPSHKILVTGGGTGNASDKLLEIAGNLANQSDFQIMLDQSLFNRRGKGHFSLFDFSASSFLSLDAIVCRPGMGILTDAVKYGIPVCVPEDVDGEMKHNSKRVEELGIGVLIKTKDHDSFVEDLYERSMEMRLKIESLQTGGAAMAAAYILNC